MLSAPLRRELAALLSLAWPIVIAQCAQTANSFVDTVMAGQASARDLAGVALGTSIWLPPFLALLGILTATAPIVSHLLGAGRRAEIGPAAHQALWVAGPLGLIGALALWNNRPLLEWLAISPELLPVTEGFLQGIAFGFPAVSLFLAIRFYTDGVGHTRPVMIVSITALLANIPANYALIFGKWGAPAMGGAGCGWATGIMMWVSLVAMLVCAVWVDRREQTHFFQWPRPRWSGIRALLKLGIPVGLMGFFETSIFCVIGILVAGLGESVIAAHQIALNASTLTFMLPLSVSLAMSIRVGHAIGARDEARLRLTIRVGMALTLTIAVFNAMIMNLGRHVIPALYTQDLQVVAIAGGLLLLAGIFQIPDGLQTGASGVLRGMKDTRIPMFILLFSHWVIGISVGCALGYGWLGFPALGAAGFWAGLIAGLSAAAILLNLRLRRLLQCGLPPADDAHA